MKVLIVDNNKVILGFLSDILSKEGFIVVMAESGEAAIEQYKSCDPDFICLDIMMPGMSGYDVCKEIRQQDKEIPIIFITSKAETVHKIEGLEVGGDDYIIKPFDTNEVIARIRAVARRSIKNKKTPENESFVIADLQVVPNKLSASRDGNIIDLNLRDIKILRLLHEQKNAVVHRDTLIDYCWGAHIMPESRTVDWHVSQLRKKIELDPKSPEIIKTVHGVGYRYEEK